LAMRGRSLPCDLDGGARGIDRCALLAPRATPDDCRTFGGRKLQRGIGTHERGPRYPMSGRRGEDVERVSPAVGGRSARRSRRSSLSRLFGVGMILGVLGMVPGHGVAQTVLARVVDADSRAPVQGALAYLLDSGGATVRNVLTDQIGRALFVNVPSGTYRVRVEMIGRATQETSVLEVGPGAARQIEIALASSAILLEGIEVRADERCTVRPDEGLAIARVWEEARKALTAAAFTERQDYYRYRTELYERDLDREARVVLRSSSSERQAFGRVPFQSVPVEELLTQGFVRQGPDGGNIFHAPDAEVLLSDAFLDAHCLRLREGRRESEGLVGVAFEPVGERSRRLADIVGTLWLDPETAELRWLEYRYVNILPGIATDLIGGRVEFQRLENGTWIIPEWWIRMPRLVQEIGGMGAPRVRIDGYRQSGGRVTEVRSSGGAGFLRGETGTIEGFVQDSLGILPLRGVRVGVVGSNQMVFTDDEGRFRITGLGDGTYRIRFVDTRMEPYGVEPDPVEREVRRGEVTSMFFRMPPLSDLLFAVCRAEAPPEGTAVLTGRVTDPRGPGPLAGVSVRVTWEDFLMTPRGAGPRTITGAQVEGVMVTTDDDGFYRMCAVPAGRLLRYSVERDGRASVADTLRIPNFERARAHDIMWSPR